MTPLLIFSLLLISLIRLLDRNVYVIRVLVGIWSDFLGISSFDYLNHKSCFAAEEALSTYSEKNEKKPDNGLTCSRYRSYLVGRSPHFINRCGKDSLFYLPEDSRPRLNQNESCCIYIYKNISINRYPPVIFVLILVHLDRKLELMAACYQSSVMMILRLSHRQISVLKKNGLMIYSSYSSLESYLLVSSHYCL